MKSFFWHIMLVLTAVSIMTVIFLTARPATAEWWMEGERTGATAFCASEKAAAEAAVAYGASRSHGSTTFTRLITEGKCIRSRGGQPFPVILVERFGAYPLAEPGRGEIGLELWSIRLPDGNLGYGLYGIPPEGTPGSGHTHAEKEAITI